MVLKSTIDIVSSNTIAIERVDSDSPNNYNNYNIPFKSFFYIKNEGIFILSLRVILTKFLLLENIYMFDEITLKSIKSMNQYKYIEFIEDKDLNYHYLEHPMNFQISFTGFTEEGNANPKGKKWNRVIFYKWIISLLEETKHYNNFNKILSRYISNDLDTFFLKSIEDLDFLLNSVKNIHRDMLYPFMFLYYELDKREITNWDNILGGHVESSNHLFSQVINRKTREKIIIEVVQAAKIYSKNLSSIICDSNNLNQTVNYFKKEVNRIINKHTMYVETKEINFKKWFLSLSYFLLYCRPLIFDLKKAISKLNLIIFLCFDNVDELHESKIVDCIKESSDGKKETYHLSEKDIFNLIDFHPFLRCNFFQTSTFE